MSQKDYEKKNMKNNHPAIFISRLLIIVLVFTFSLTTHVNSISPAAYQAGLQQRTRQLITAGQSNSYINIGDTITFGRYEQDGITSNGEEPIEWIVLKADGNQILVVSKYGLDSMPFNTDEKEGRWDKSSIRKWLNSVFFNVAFDSSEKTQIVAKSSTYEDKVVLLANTDAERYFSSDYARQTKPTVYAKKMGVHTDENGNCTWWLCSSYFNPATVCTVNSNGKVVEPGIYPDTLNIAVRPAIWLSIDN